MLANDVLHTIGNTPHIRINRLFGNATASTSRASARTPAARSRTASRWRWSRRPRLGALRPGGTIIEPTSGNTGIGLAMVAAVKGYKLVLVMPDSMCVERRRLMLAYGATFELTPREKGMNGAIARAEEIVAATPGAWMPQQFENPANIEVHVRTTAQEILADFPSGIDALITGVGTGGHITGCAQVLKAKWPKLKVFAVEPARRRSSAAASRVRIRSRASAPASSRRTCDVDLLDGVIQVEAEAAREMARRCGARGGHAGRHLVRCHAGRDRAEAARTAEGRDRARLQLRHRRALPVDRGVPAGMMRPPPLQLAPRCPCHKPRILIVEDEPGIADTLQYALRTDGFEPRVVRHRRGGAGADRAASRRRS